MAKETVRVTFLGGLGEIGRNCAAIEQDGRIVVVDAGLMFPEPTMYGVDLILPDFRWLIERRDRVDAIVLTHGHEDHTGALRYLVKDINVPIYGSALTLGFARHRLTEAKVAKDLTFIEVSDGEKRKIGPFEVEFIPVTHSVPSAHALAFRTNAGIVVHSGDFKLDLTPIDGRRTDISRLAALGDEGVALLLADSTNAEEPGFTASERSVGGALRRLFLERPERRMVVACFASHIHRVQQIIDVALEQHRKIVLMGRSMEANVKLARKLNLLHVGAADLIDIENIDRYAPGEVCVICTGSQGEPLAALSKLVARRRAVLQGGRRRHRHTQFAPDSRQRVDGRTRHRRPAPRRGRGDPLGPRAGPRVGPRAPGRTAHLPPTAATAELRAGPRRVPPHGAPRRVGATPWDSVPSTS